MSDNLPEEWEPYAVQPSHGFLFWLAVIALFAVFGFNLWWKFGGYQIARGCVPMFNANKPVIVCEREP